MTYNPDGISSDLIKKGHDFADKEAAASLLEETKKTLRAQIAVSNLPEAGSVSKAELIAEGTREYIDHIKSMVTARKEANKARVNYDAQRVWVDLVRTQESTRRAEMGMR